MEHPRIRPVDAFPLETENGQMVGLRDPSGIAEDILILSPDVFYLLQYFDGKHDRLRLREQYRLIFGESLSEGQLEEIIDHLDAYSFLESPTFLKRRAEMEKSFLDAPTRPAAHAGQSYEADPQRLKAQLDGFYASETGAGTPQSNGNPTHIKGFLAPHVDIRAGGACYSHAYRALAESDGADCFVILGTGHSGLMDLYSTLAKDFETPLGVVKHDAEFIKLLEQNYPDIARSEVLPHKTEHVIEFQLVFLQHLYAMKRAFTFVPLLCSFSYHMLKDSRLAREKSIVENFSEALRKTISMYGKRVCLVGSVDFSHVGPRYGDENSPDKAFFEEVSRFDNSLLKHIETLNAQAFCDTVAEHEDRYRVCGFSSIYTLLNAIEAKEGKLLDYANTEVDTQKSRVTFASVTFQ